MKRLVALLAIALPSLAGSLYQHWYTTVPGGGHLEAYVDCVTVTGSAVPGGTPSGTRIEVSLSTLATQVRGLSINLSVLMDDGTIFSLYRANLPMPEKPGTPIVVSAPVGTGLPLRVVLFSVSPLIVNDPIVLVR